MAKSNFKFEERKNISTADAEKRATENDAKVTNFSIDAENGEKLTLTGKFKESVWERFEEGKTEPVGSGVSLYAVATKADGTKIDIPFGLFKGANKLASGGEVIECKARFGKNATQTSILDFCKTKAEITVARYVFFREGNDFETEITKVL